MQISGKHNHTLLVEGILESQSSSGKTAHWYKAEGLRHKVIRLRILDLQLFRLGISDYQIREFIDGRTYLKNSSLRSRARRRFGLKAERT
jgi:hypothetical protein